eukprot:scaffold26944_cov63-Phaeocystis_antarctica.AAC.2
MARSSSRSAGSSSSCSSRSGCSPAPASAPPPPPLPGHTRGTPSASSSWCTSCISSRSALDRRLLSTPLPYSGHATPTLPPPPLPPAPAPPPPPAPAPAPAVPGPPPAASGASTASCMREREPTGRTACLRRSPRWRAAAPTSWAA